MSTHPLRIDSELFNLARNDSAVMDRTPTAQVEFWAKLGRAADAIFRADSIRELKSAAAVENLAELLAKADTPAGRARFAAVVTRHGVPLYSADPAEPGCIIEKQPDGTRRKGKFVNRKFVAFTREEPKVR